MGIGEWANGKGEKGKVGRMKNVVCVEAKVFGDWIGLFYDFDSVCSRERK